LKGLDDCILPYVHFFLNNNINGCRLLLLSCDDLNHLNVCKVGHQELILEAVDLLKHLHYNFGSETLQSLALRLGCKARSLFNQLKNNQLSQTNDCDNNYNNDERVSTPTLSAVSDILAAVKSFISWIDRYFNFGRNLSFSHLFLRIS
jgi:connector enhancer of kinase suppressor of Ras 2